MEDGRITRPMWFLKTILGLSFIGFVVMLLLPYASTAPKYCTHLRTMEKSTRDITRENPLLYNVNQYMSQVKDSESRYDCTSQENIATIIVFTGVFLIATMSLIAPSKKRFVPIHSSATTVLGNLMYFVGLSSILVWTYSSENRLKILNYF